MKGGTGISMICLNSNGFPSNKNNVHKIKRMKELLEDQDAAVILETGVNKQTQLLEPREELNIGRLNVMKEIEKDQYQHNGSGTAILINRNYDHLPARELFNDHKKVTEIIVNANKTR